MALLQFPLSQFKSLSLSTPFLHGSSPTTLLTKPSSVSYRRRTFLPPVCALKILQGRVISNANDKTVNVRVARLAAHPKYKKRVRKLKKYQAHDPDNQFQVGDIVQLVQCRPISKTKSFIAVPAPQRNASRPKEVAPDDLGLPLESDSSPQAE